MVKGIHVFQSKHDGNCINCALGKNTKNKFPSGTNRSRGILDLIQSNLSGPMLAPSLSGYLYYVFFIDNFSRNSWIYFLKAKSEKFSKFQEFKVLVDSRTRKHIRALRYDNGGEFESRAFNDFYSDEGICR